jgi:hypothetical protein
MTGKRVLRIGLDPCRIDCDSDFIRGMSANEKDKARRMP